MSIVQLLINAAKTAGLIVQAYKDFLEEEKLTASDAESGDFFGHSVSISNDGSRVIVSAWSEDADAGDFRGAAYVYSRSGTTWTQEQKLLASDAQSFDAFGNGEVSISGDGTRVIVGAYLEDGGAGNGANLGAAYVFSRSGTTWTQEQKLTASDADLSDEFGISAAISDDGSRAIVGAWGEDGAGSNRGAAYVFSRSGTTWTQEQKLTASDTQDNDRFGNAVSISDDGSRVIVGAYQEDGGAGDPLSQSGAAYVFSRSGTTWTEEQILRASDAQADDVFGWAVSISGDGTRVIVGAYDEDGGAGDPLSQSGAAYVFSRSGTTWTEEQKLTASDTVAGDVFGYSVAMSDDGTRVIVGALYEDGGAGDPILNAGAAYVFSRSGTTWTEEQILYASDAQAQDLFGYSVAISDDGTRCIVGARDEDGGAGDPISNAGAAYVFDTSYIFAEEQKLTASDAQTSDGFGYSVAISDDGTRAIVGAYLEDGGAGNPTGDSGAAYVYSRSGTTWTEEQILYASDAQASDLFGWSVAMSGDGTRCIVTARDEDGGAGDPILQAGAAYVFSRSGTTWTEEQILRASDAQANDKFGQSVAMSDDGSRVIVGADDEDGGAGNPTNASGAAYVFSRSGTTWTEEQKLTASDAQANDNFSWSVAISDDGTRVIVGANTEDGGAGDPTSNSGAAYVYSRSGTTWTEEQILRASDAFNNDTFGRSVAISDDGTRCIVGASGEDGGAGDPISNAGAAYVFSRSGTTWTEEQILRASDAQTNDTFGHSVAISDDGTRAIVIAYGEDGGAGDPTDLAGAAYVFSRSGTTWTEEQILRASDAQALDQFGWRVAMSGDGTRCIVSTYFEDGGAGDPIFNAGAAYVFST